MKNIFLLIACSSLFFLASCEKKSYTCRCDGGFSGAGDVLNIKAISQKRAQKKCADHNSGPDTNDGYNNCRLE